MGGNLGGPVFKRIAEQVLAYLDVAHDVPVNSDSEFARKAAQATPAPNDAIEQANLRAEDRRAQQEQATFQTVVSQSTPRRANSEQGAAPTIAFSEEDAVSIPDLTGQTVRSVTESCSRLGLVPMLIGNGVAVEQTPDPGAVVERGSTVTVRFAKVVAAARGVAQPNVPSANQATSAPGNAN
jgi:stage V sporulation protein D (sporulation-specific penicillin-binding protein)